MPVEGSLKDWLGTNEVARLLDISQSAVRRLYYRGTLAGTRKAAQIFFRRETVFALMRDPEFIKRRRNQRNEDGETPSLWAEDVPVEAKNGK